MSQPALAAVRLTQNDEEVLGLFGRLKSNISDIKASSNSLRSSVDRSLHSSREVLSLNRVDDRSDMDASHGISIGSSRGKTSRQSSIRSDRPSDLKIRHNEANNSSKDTRDGSINEPDRSLRKDANRSRVSSYSSRDPGPGSPGDSSRTATGEREDDSSRARKSYPSQSDQSSRGEHSYGSLKREHTKASRDGRDSRASERSTKSHRSQGLTDQYLEQYHREWMMHWNMQQMNQSQMYEYGWVPQRSAMGNGAWPQPGLRTVGSTSSLIGMANMSANISAPSTPLVPAGRMLGLAQPPDSGSMVGGRERPAAVVSPGQPPVSAFKPYAQRGSVAGVGLRQPMRPAREEWHGCLVSTNKVAGITRSGRSTAVFVKDAPAQSEKMRTEMEMFPGMLLWDDADLRDRVVDFCRHMSSVVRETDESFTSEMEAVYWDLVVHLVSRGENSRPYEVAQILARLLQDPGRSSVASTRSEATTRGGREKYAEASLILVRRCLLAGDIESAVVHAENGDCWDLALCLQTVQSNVECKNQQANDMALKMLDQKLHRGDPVHTICLLACGKMPNVEACFKDWVSNLAVVLACSGFVSLGDLRLRFVTALADLLHTAGMSMARDICTVFGNPERRFKTKPFMLIGSSDDEFSLSGFFMTEIYAYLAQILQGVNLHVSVDLIRVEMNYARHLVDSQLGNLAEDYCRNIAVVVRDYSVQMGFELYATLLDVATACIAEKPAVVQEDWFQWMWKIFETYRRRNQPAVEYPATPNLSPRQTEAPQFADIPAQTDSMSSSSYNPETSVSEPNVPFFQGPPSETMTSSRRGSSSLEVEPPFLPTVTNQHESRRNSEIPVKPVPLDRDFMGEMGMRSSRANSISVTHHEPSSDPPAPAIPMFSVNNPVHAPNRPSFFTPFPPPGALPNFQPQELSFPPIESPFNTGNAPHFDSIQAATPDTGLSEAEEEKENKSPQIYDPTRMYDEPDTFGTKPGKGKAKDTEKSDNAQKAGWFSSMFPRSTKPLGDEKVAEPAKKNQTGWFSGIVRKLKGPQQVHLPDDKNKMVYDEKRKRWVDPSKPVEDEQEEVLAPPPKMVFPQPDFSMANGPSVPTPGIPNGNAFRIGGGGGRGYNPYATIMAGIQSAPLKPMDLTNHFIPASIPEE